MLVTASIRAQQHNAGRGKFTEGIDMKTSKPFHIVVATALILLCAILFVGIAQTARDDPGHKKNQKPVHLIPSLDGAELFKAYCATCHGLSGKGDGPIASVLDTPPSDLTAISKKNGGIFPANRVRTIIAGEDLIKAHGTREMPIWGPIFHQVERDQDFGNVRLQNVTRYVESIQQR